MSAEEVTAYIEKQGEPKRSTLLAVREAILEIEPSLEQVIAWNTPQFKFNGKYAVGAPLPKALLAKLIKARIAELG